MVAGNVMEIQKKHICVQVYVDNIKNDNLKKHYINTKQDYELKNWVEGLSDKAYYP